MSLRDTVIPLLDLRAPTRAAPAFAVRDLDRIGLDALGRPLTDLRISVTDRCNFRCVYCMPKAVFDKDHPFLPHDALLTFEEIERVARIFVSQGVRKIRLTGGEPLLRRHIERLIEMLSRLRTPDGLAVDLALTTNGALLARKARSLTEAGLKRVTVSLDALNDEVFRRMNDVDFPVSSVLDGIHEAQAQGLGPVKINMVVKRGWNDQEILPMVRYFAPYPVALRFIEYMDVGDSNDWRLDEVVSSREILDRLRAAGIVLTRRAAKDPSETAQRYQIDSGPAEIGLISSVTEAFCHACSRIRLSTEGKLYSCLFASSGFDLRTLLRAVDPPCEDATLVRHLASLWAARSDQYSAHRTEHTRRTGKIEMSYIGG